MRRSVIVAMMLTAGAAIGVGAFFVGRATAPAHPSSSVGDYFDGLRAGEAEGRQEGRALQEGNALPADARKPAQRAFDAGYVAGMNDVFAGYDGGWTLGVPWIITLEGGSGQVDYRIQGRTPVMPGVDYYLCSDGRRLCHEPR